ncbi:MAG: Xaa-Pro peptidase family protein [Pseudomonadota bacterium]
MIPARGFPPSEYEARTNRAQRLMAQSGLSALLMTTEPEIRYYTGFLTRFWESPTRPWFVVLPEAGRPIAVIPAIGAHLMGQSWVSDIRSWAAPDYTDDGVGLLAETLKERVPAGGTIGVADGMESHLRMPLQSFDALKEALGSRRILGDGGITRHLRCVKSEAEIAKIRIAAEIAGRAFDRVGELARADVSLAAVFRGFQILCLEEGADWVPYLAGVAEPGGYRDVIAPATDRPLRAGDVMMLDIGLVWDGYFCDFDRNFSVGPPALSIQAAHARLVEASQGAAAAARPGATASDLFHAMRAILGSAGATGRLGHGLGMQLTEWPSVHAADRTVLEDGMVLTLEPVIDLPDGRILVHEENIVVRPGGAVFLTAPQVPGIRCL